MVSYKTHYPKSTTHYIAEWYVCLVVNKPPLFRSQISVFRVVLGYFRFSVVSKEIVLLKSYYYVNATAFYSHKQPVPITKLSGFWIPLRPSFSLYQILVYCPSFIADWLFSLLSSSQSHTPAYFVSYVYPCILFIAITCKLVVCLGILYTMPTKQAFSMPCY